jgi:hypothetical protein
MKTLRKTAWLGLLLACGGIGCDPLGMLVVNAVHPPEKTEHLVVINEPDFFFRSADHHDFKAVETYEWRNCGTAALVDLEVTPSCPNDVTVRIYDAEDALVFDHTFHAPHCFHGKKDWPPMPTETGVPGVWRIELTFDLEAVKDLEILITRLGECELDVTVCHGNNGVGNGEDPQPPGQPPVNDGDGTTPGNPGNQGGPYLLWKSGHTHGRDVTETYLLKLNGTATTVEASWETLTEGELELTIRDAAEQIVYSHLFAAGHPQPFAVATAPGAPGLWKVTIRASGLTSSKLRLVVYAP